MTAPRIQSLWPWPRHSKADETHPTGDAREPQNVGAPARRAAHARPAEHAALPPLPPNGRAVLHNHLFQALETAQMPDLSTADAVLTRHEALRYWIPKFKAWRTHPARAEAFFQNTQWPPLDPIAAGVLVGLAYRARIAACAKTSDSARGARQRVNLAAATHRGLLHIPDMQPYAAVLAYVEERDRKQPLPDRFNYANRTLWALTTDIESLAPDARRMQKVAAEVLALYPSEGLLYNKVKRVPKPIAWEIELQEAAEATHLETLQSAVVSFIQYHNQETTGQEIVQEIRALIQASADDPELLANLHFCQKPLSLRSDFLAGALVATLYLGMLCGLRDLHRAGKRRDTALMIAHSKLVSERMHKALGALATAIDPEQWRQLAFIVHNSLDAGVGIHEIRARVDTFIKTQSYQLGCIAHPTVNQTSLADQWRGVRWRLVRYPVTKL